MAAYRTQSGAAVYLPEPIDVPDDYPPEHLCVFVDPRQASAPRARSGKALRPLGFFKGFVVAFLLLCLVGALALRAARPAAAQHPEPPCAAPSSLAKHLATEYDEAPIALGVLGNGELLEIYHSEARGTWTVVITMWTGKILQSCIIAAGKGFEMVPVGAAT